jgi:hypothetical protein
MEKFELELNEEHLAAIGKITVNFATLEQILSFFIGSLIQKDDLFVKAVATMSSIPEYSLFLEFYISTRTGLERKPGNRLGQIITSELAFRQKVDILGALLKENINDTVKWKELDSILARLQKAEEKRNAAVHSLWTMSEADGKVDRIKVTAKKKTGYRLVVDCMNVEELENIAKYFAELSYEIHGLIIRLYTTGF